LLSFLLPILRLLLLLPWHWRVKTCCDSEWREREEGREIMIEREEEVVVVVVVVNGDGGEW